MPFTEALFRGLAPDGGLYVPEAVLPLETAAMLGGSSFGDTALRMAEGLLGDEIPGPILEDVVAEALDFPVPLVSAGGDIHLLELFHGPTLAFKDVGARFMAALMERLDPEPGEGRTVLVATSGDTGSAVAHAFAGRPRFRVVVLYPRDGVSEVQRRLFSTPGGNVVAVAVRGDFDDCQRLAKGAFQAPSARRSRLTSANSINVGRLVPQSFYYAEAVRLGGWARKGCVFSVPSGNLGNLTGGLLAALAGLPVRRFVAALNINDAFHRYLTSGSYRPSETRRTVSNAMDVGDPSNRERIDALLGRDVRSMRELVWTASFGDDRTLECVRRFAEGSDCLLDPHAAVGVLGAEAFRRETKSSDPVVVLATAHPAKFPEVMERAVGHPAEPPPRLVRALHGEEHITEIGPHLPELLALLEESDSGWGA